MPNRALLFIATVFCLLPIAWGSKNDPKTATACNLLMGQLLNHSARNGSLKESRDFFPSTYGRFPNAFGDKSLYHRELSDAFRASQFVRELGVDDYRAKFYLFEGLDSLKRTWQFIFRVNQGDMTLDGELISANPASFDPYQVRTPFDIVTMDMNPEAHTRESLIIVTTKVTAMMEKKEVTITSQVYTNMSERNLSELDLFHILKTGNTRSSLGIDQFGVTRYIWMGNDLTGNPFRLVIGVGEKVIIISAASKPLERGD